MRLIDANALPVCKEHYIDQCGFGANFYVVHKIDIDAAPTITIEAEPVKHGRWELHGNDDDFGYSYFCSNCHANYDEDYFYEHGDFVPYNRCPNCGAKMDLEEIT